MVLDVIGICRLETSVMGAHVAYTDYDFLLVKVDVALQGHVLGKPTPSAPCQVDRLSTSSKHVSAAVHPLLCMDLLGSLDAHSM